MSPMFLLSTPSGSEWIIILIVVLLIFGGRKIPELMRGIGRGVKEFKDAKDGSTGEGKEVESKKD